MKKKLKCKSAFRGLQRNGNVQIKDPQRVGEWIFSGKIHLNYRYIRYQPMKHSYDKIICFQYFSFDKEL